jgi:hypothetical protein
VTGFFAMGYNPKCKAGAIHRKNLSFIGCFSEARNRA